MVTMTISEFALIAVQELTPGILIFSIRPIVGASALFGYHMHHPIFKYGWFQAGLFASGLAAATAKGVTPILPLGFMFDWNDPQAPVPIPTTEQCETIHITWGRRTATGPNPVAPYYLQVFTSNSTVPFLIPAGDQLQFDWTVPFAPGTLYQICMYDMLGTTGGCQATYTVIPPSDPILPSNCTNVTLVPQLDVDARDHTGPLSRFGFTDQCTDISITPLSGVPPFTLTVAPPLHPPYNITSFDMKAINWTVSLNWAMPFFIGLSDSNGSMWSNGPLHAASGGSIGCLAGNKTTSHQVGVPAAVGITFVILIFGVMSGVGGTQALAAYRRRKLDNDNFIKLPEGGALETRESQRRARPFPAAEEEQEANKQVYVLHHDSNMAPVTIIHQGGTNVVELPPVYPYSPRQSAVPTERQGVSSAQLRTDSSRARVELTDQERREGNHYNPRGPWQPRRPTGIRKPSDRGPP